MEIWVAACVEFDNNVFFSARAERAHNDRGRRNVQYSERNVGGGRDSRGARGALTPVAIPTSKSRKVVNGNRIVGV